MMSRYYDIVIVGAGPAGLSAAFFIKQLDPSKDVLIVERLSEERWCHYHSICGEGISLRAFKDLKPITPWAKKENVGRAVIHWPEDVTTTQSLNGVILDRPRFLDELRSSFQERGGDVLKGSVRSVSGNEKGFLTLLSDGNEIRSRYIIGADGAFSTVRRDLFGSRPKCIVPVDRYILDVEPDHGVMHFYINSEYKGGYKWEFPSGDATNAGLPAGTGRINNFIEKGSRFLPFGGVGPVVKGNAILIGDAAAQANPVCFGGLRISMTAGKKAAEAIVKGVPNRYQEWWSKSSFSSPLFMKAHTVLASWTDKEMYNAAVPFQRRARVRPFISRFFSSPHDAHIYIAYVLTFLEGW